MDELLLIAKNQRPDVGMQAISPNNKVKATRCARAENNRYARFILGNMGDGIIKNICCIPAVGLIQNLEPGRRA